MRRNTVRILVALTIFLGLAALFWQLPDRDVAQEQSAVGPAPVAAETDATAAAPPDLAPAPSSVEEPALPESSPPSEEERRARILANIEAVLATIDPDAFPPADEMEFARIVQSMLLSEMVGGDVEWLLEHFLARLPGGVEGATLAPDDQRALIASHLFLGIVFSNLEHENFDQLFAEGIADRMLARVLGAFEHLSPEAQSYLAVALYADEMLRGSFPASLIEGLLALEPRPKGLELLIEGYAKDPEGSEFVAQIGSDHFDFGVHGGDDKVLVPAITEHLRQLAPAARYATAKTLVARGRTHAEQGMVLRSVSRMGDAQVLYDLARASLNDPEQRKGPILDESSFRGPILELVMEGHLSADDLLDRIAAEPEDLVLASIYGLGEAGDPSAFRFLLGLEGRGSRTRPQLSFRASTSALFGLAKIAAPPSLDARVLAVLEALLPGATTDLEMVYWSSAAEVLARHTGHDSIKTAVKTILGAIASDPDRSESMRATAASCLARL